MAAVKTETKWLPCSVGQHLACKGVEMKHGYAIARCGCSCHPKVAYAPPLAQPKVELVNDASTSEIIEA